MVDKEVIRENKEVETETTRPVGVRPSEIVTARRKRRGLIALLIALGVVILGLLIAAAALAFAGLSNNNNSMTNTQGTFNGNRGYSRLVGNTGYGYGTGTSTTVDNGSVQTTVYTYLTGVVTQVNSGSIVIAGNGKTTTITTNSSTVYDNSTKPAVNDTVTVAGTTSGSTTTATEIAVNNQ